MKTHLDQGLDRWEEVAITLNNIVKQQGEIAINNRDIWDGLLHRWENEDWEQALTAVATLMEQHPKIFKKYHRDAFQEAARTLVKHMDSTDRVLDKKLYKKTAWKMIMSMRELWNQAQTYTPEKKEERKLPEFNSMFE